MSTSDLPPTAFSLEFPRAMGRPANAALVNRGISTLEQVTQYTEKELLQIHGVGPKAIRVLNEHLATQGRSLRHEN
jgi:predicted flap endonuclease-1-like 5' DNA nuclease